MKLHKVRLFNLNSLYGEHIIDFENDLGHAPLFLILGQTGAGKSTILDGICLALFGQTPRLPRIAGRPDTDARLLMSHGTAQCAVELEFSRLLSDGSRQKYRAGWSCRRSRGKPDGNLQDPQRSLTRLLDDGVEELIISDKRVKYIKPVFEEHLDHLTVHDFQRSVLLAQGEFAAFLRAGESEKASILERLTNTDMYKRIGQRAAMRRRQAKRELETIEQRLQDLQLLERHEEEALQSSFEELEAALDGLRSEYKNAQDASLWLSQRQKLEEAFVVMEADCAKAQEVLDGFADELQRLAEDQRCQSANTPLREADAAKETLGALEEDLGPLREEEALAIEAFDARVAEEETLAELRSAAHKALEEARPMLEKAEGLQRILGRCEAELDKSEQNHKEALARSQDCDARCKETSEQLKDKTRLRDENQVAFDAIAFAAPLVESHAALVYQTNHLNELIESVGEAMAECDSLKKKRKSLKQKISLRRKKLEDAQGQLEPFQQRQEEAVAAKAELLGELPDLRTLREGIDAQREERQEERHTLEDALRSHTDLAELLQDVRKHEQECAAMEWELQELRPKIELKQREYTRIDKLLEAEEIAFRTIERTLALDDARRELAEDAPCPLCGSHDHPYVGGDDDGSPLAQFEAERKHIENSIISTKKELKERQEELRELDRDLTRKTTASQQLNEQMKEVARRKERLLDGYLTACSLLQLDGLTEAPSNDDEAQKPRFPESPGAQSSARAALEQRQKEIDEEITTHTKTIKDIDDLRDELAEAAQALEDARKESDALAQELHELEKLLELREEELHDWSERLDTRNSKWRDECDALVALFGSFHIEIDSKPLVKANSQESMSTAITVFADALAKASQHKQEYEEVLRVQDALREQLKEAEQAAKQASEAHEAAQQRLQEAEEEVKARQDEQRQAQEELAAVLGKDTLEETQERLQRAVDDAEAKSQANQDALATAREARSKQQTLREAKEAAVESQQAVLVAKQKALQDALSSLGLDDRTALLAVLLEDDEREAIKASVEDARQTSAQAVFQRDAAKEAVATHAAQQPDIENLLETDESSWEEKAQTLQSTLEDKREEMGVLREKMKQHQEAKQLAAEYEDSLQSTRESFRVWETIDRIIGVGDGERFKQFAQSLNLQELVDRANDRLLRLNPRYTLAVATGESGEPKLDFVIKDRHHAEHERPLTTLSGGETFLVSLALALALADFRRIDMPIETLLLDEGFGTLDQDTLDIAMSTLRQLQQESSQQIGLISHVEMLKERIDTRIIVEKIGNGRSKLSIEGAPATNVPAPLT